MRPNRLFLSLLLFLAGLSGIALSADGPGAEVQAFLDAYHKLAFTGLPKPAQLKALTSHLSPRLTDLIRRARTAQEQYIERYPEETPPLVDEDLFSSLFEGATAFAIGETAMEGNRATVLVQFTYKDSRAESESVTWKDRYLLVKVGSKWQIEDVEYLGDWEYALSGCLSDVLNDVVAGPE